MGKQETTIGDPLDDFDDLFPSLTGKATFSSWQPASSEMPDGDGCSKQAKIAEKGALDLKFFSLLDSTQISGSGSGSGSGSEGRPMKK